MNLLFGLIGAAILASLHRGRPLPRLPRAYIACGLLMAAYGATVAEGFAWAGLFNLVEHLCLAGSGVAFALAVLDLGRRGRPGGEGPPGEGAA